MNSFAEVNESYTLSEAIQEAQRCLGCKVPQCRQGCPINNDIPEWIHELRKGNLGNAIHIIRAKSNLPAVCGRVCGHERQCEGACVLGKTGKHINIGKLERFVADFDAEAHLTHEKMAPKTRGRVAVIGSGPAGITVAGDLSRAGFSVEIFELEAEPGGILMYGIPEYRLPKEVVRREIHHLEELGVIIHCNVHVGVDLTVDDLFAQGFDAIFLGIGAGKPGDLDVPVTVEGSDEILSSSRGMYDVRHAANFLRRVMLYRGGAIREEDLDVHEDDRVYVVGCGNTSIDAARSAIRLGARSVDIVYRKDVERMPALRAEYEDAVAEGVAFRWLSSIVEMHVDRDKRLKEIVVETQSLDGGEASRVTLPADEVLMAVGSKPSTRIVNTTTGIEADGKGFIPTREMPYGMTSRKGVFAGGDVANRQATVVHAMRDAKMVAEGIAKYVDAIKLIASLERVEGTCQEHSDAEQ